MVETPKGNRLHIGIFGRVNSGKSSLINALTGQELAVVSEVPGTTTDPVKKAVELRGIGPCLFIDTAGFEDEGELGSFRLDKTKGAASEADIALLVVSVMPTLQFQMDRRAENPLIKIVSAVVVIAFSAFMVIGRMIAGVHWATDIIGSILLSAGLFSLYRTAVIFADGKRAKQHPEEFVNGVQ